MLEEAEKAYQKAFAMVEDLNKEIDQKEKILDSLNLIPTYQTFQLLLKKHVSLSDSLIGMLEQLVSELQIYLLKLCAEEERLQKRLQKVQSGGSSDRRAIEKLEKEMEKLHKEKGSSQDTLKLQLEELCKETRDSDKSISEAKDKLNNLQIRCIVEGLEERLNNALLEIENRGQCIQELEKELSELKNLSIADQESMKEEINRLRQFLSDDDYKKADVTNQIKQLAILTEQNSILQQKLKQLEVERKEERTNFENDLRAAKEVNRDQLDEIITKYESKIKNMQSEHDLFKENAKREINKKSETIRKIEKELVKSRNTLLLFNQMLNDYYNELAAAVYSEVIPSSILDKYVALREVLAKKLESENCYSEDYVNHIEDPTRRQLDAADWKILHLESEIEEIQERLGGIKESEERNEKLEKLVEKVKKLEVCLQVMMKALPEENIQ
ncbi:hypothetical protein [Chlamydia crocodili]|uniref:Uncharacterized protein n=2 Tax=Chlamydia crocodili TaxID=2766982 RepID=A0ABX8CE85_9CHLA|nr:hypothetical protein [Chlamydia crocodili]QVE49320.1 hypothetical protein H9Q19_01240 [Chlamydia crocodili]